MDLTSIDLRSEIDESTPRHIRDRDRKAVQSLVA
jgi:hypothetical protein